ncbi:MAG: hypothetical protein R3F59_15260 [Myxococcota bacterium]
MPVAYTPSGARGRGVPLAALVSALSAVAVGAPRPTCPRRWAWPSP